MEITPQRVRSAEFKTVRKGADPDEVKVFLGDVADELERAQNQSTAMEARARAAVARLQEVSESAPAPAAPTPAVEPSADETDTISRTLLLAQRTADNTVAEARGEAARIVSVANDEAATTLDSTREMSAQLVAEARAEARQVGESERASIASEVEALMARRDFLESDVEQLELFLSEQRSRLRDAATALVDITERVPGGLGDARPPLLSASDDDNGDGDTADTPDATRTDAAADDVDDLTIVTEIADGDTVGAPASETDPTASSAPSEGTGEGSESTESSGSSDLSWSDEGDPTQAMPTIDSPDADDATSNDEFRFSFDDDRR